jgi:hypothetical protein
MLKRIWLLCGMTGVAAALLFLSGCDALRASKVHGPASAEQVDKQSRQVKDIDSK